MKAPVYLDYNATTPVDQRVLEYMLPFFGEQFGNAASSTHAYGWVAEKAVKEAREAIAECLNCESREVIFTSGATESLNLAIKGVAKRYQQKGKHLITVQTEHKAVLDCMLSLEKEGFEVTYLPVDGSGLISLEDVQAHLRPDTILVAVMVANNETGVIQPIQAISEIVHKNNSLLLCDGVQAFGKIPVDVQSLGIDLLALSAHKMYGPKGVGALYVRKRRPRVSLFPLIEGGGHEQGIRSGTLNVPGIVGFGKAVLIASQEMKTEADRLGILRDELVEGIARLDGTRLHAKTAPRLSHVANFSFEGINSQRLIKAMHRIAVSTGSACTSAEMKPSHVLTAMGVKEEAAYGSIRFSLGRFTTKEEIEITISEVTKGIKKLKQRGINH
ncbi:MAG: IscS subfamily cysteine desulfurase [Bacteroidota bacterium]